MLVCFHTAKVHMEMFFKDCWYMPSQHVFIYVNVRVCVCTRVRVCMRDLNLLISASELVLWFYYRLMLQRCSCADWPEPAQPRGEKWGTHVGSMGRGGQTLSWHQNQKPSS